MDARRSIYLNSDHDDLTAKADRSNAVAIHVTLVNDNVPTSLRLRAHCGVLGMPT
jgi:hypothetical protein